MNKFKLILSTIIICSVLFSSFVPAQAMGDLNKIKGSVFSPVGNLYCNIVRDINKKSIVNPPVARPLQIGYESGYNTALPERFDFDLKTETWISNEITLVSSKNYSDPFNDVELDVYLFCDGKKYTMPGFWDGGNIWKFRFCCPFAGNWTFVTVCSDKLNTGLNDITGSVICNDYSGNLEIYKHGFVTTGATKKYFTYNDGTPFFYLGDTHWSLGDETTEMVEVICKKRYSQGFNVIQSEPIGAGFDCTDGISENDIIGFRDYDYKFKIIADSGMVHANSQFFFPGYMENLIKNMGGYSEKSVKLKFNGEIQSAFELSDEVKSYLEKLSRFWVARYGSYPVVWTLGQEVDTDFYWSENNGTNWNKANNPYLLIAEYIKKYDCYCHPQSAHQENAGSVTAYGNGKGTSEKLSKYSKASPSLFRKSSAHNWFAAQWSPSLTANSDYCIEKDYWYNSQGKPVVNYEGRYCYLWTKNFGSRMQGWASYLNGMFGYGWGAHDTWSYLNTYDENNDSFDGIDNILSSEKINATWRDSLEYPSSYQAGYMKDFFLSLDWWKLEPRFGCRRYFKNDKGVYSFVSSDRDNNTMIIYFYSFSDYSIGENINTSEKNGYKTGTIRGLLSSTTYKYRWFNPVTGEFSEEHTFNSSLFGSYKIGLKQWKEQNVNSDMVFYMYR